MKPIIRTCLFLSVSLKASIFIVPTALSLFANSSNKAFSLPPPEDIPEEILRTEIILEGRSPIDGRPLSAREYEELKQDLSQRNNGPKISSDVKERIFLLQLRKALKTIIPFY